MKILITGGAGFIGSNFVRYWLENYPQDKVINYDLLTYAGNLENLKDIEKNPNYSFVRGDIGDYKIARKALEGVDWVVNFAAESHNDRAILYPEIFVKTNVLGTQIFLSAAKEAKVKRFHHISTCEVFGELELNEKRMFKETDPYAPKTPYNASKAAANHMAMAYFYTFGLPITISHCANNYGPYQFPEKLIPLFATNALEDKPLPLFYSSQNKREWIHVLDHIKAIDLILRKGRVGEAYNVGTLLEKNVEEITEIILDYLGKPKSLKNYVPDRLQHDKRYLLDPHKIEKELNWKPKIKFEDGIKQTIEWYKKNKEWWEKIKSGKYQEYYKKQYLRQ